MSVGWARAHVGAHPHVHILIPGPAKRHAPRHALHISDVLTTHPETRPKGLRCTCVCWWPDEGQRADAADLAQVI